MTTADTIKLAVMDSKYTKGIRQLSEPAPAMRFMPLRQALETGWQTDAHFVCYQPTNTADAAFPRLTKAVLPRLREAGADIVTQVFGFDYDNPGHLPWDESGFGRFWSMFNDAIARWPVAGMWSCFYTTNAGARLIYLLDEPTPVDAAEAKHRWMLSQFHTAGLPLCCECEDWTHLFRLPYVVRDGKPTWTARSGTPPMQYIARWDTAPLPAAQIPELQRALVTEYDEIRQFNDPKPSPEEARGLLEQLGARGMVQSYFYKEAKKRLKGRECYPCIFEHAPLAEPGARDSTLHQYVGQAITMLYRLEGTSPVHIYGLFLDPVLQLEPDAATPDWSSKLWDHVGRLWSKEEAKCSAEDRDRAETVETAVSAMDTLLTNVRTWCNHPVVQGHDTQAAKDWISRHMICSVKAHYFCMNRQGFYDEIQLQGQELVSRIRILGMDKLIETQKPNVQGTGWNEVSTTDILNKHATICRSIRAAPQLVEGGYIENVDTGASQLVLQSFCRNPHLEPTFSEDVDEWLGMLFGDRKMEMCEWLAWALAFEEGPICGISLEAASGVGKKMLTMGLKETLLQPAIAGAADLITSYQYGLMQSPYLVIDEGWPTYNQTRHPADQFRALVGGEPFVCNMRYEVPVHVNNPVRFIFTANNASVVQMLTANRDLSPDDRQALAIRLKHFKVDDRAALWLRQKGGLKFTGRTGARWIQGDGNGKSDHIVAKHFLWLHKHRQPPINSTGARLLVEGDLNNEMLFEMRTNSGSTPLVIETIIKLLNIPGHRDGLVVQDSRLYVITSEILNFYRDNSQSIKEKLNAATITNVLKNLIIHEWPDTTLRERPRLTRRKWYELDPEILMNYARRDGWSCQRLESLIEERNLLKDRGLGGTLEAKA